MTVFSKVRDFFSRHRNKFLVSGVVITGSILLTRYAQQKLKDWQERETKEFLDRTRKQQHFESTERTCNQTILSLVFSLNEALGKAVDTEEILNELRNNPENKIELWNTLKVAVFTKTTCMIYIAVMLVITLRVQLNVIGGYLFKDPNSISSELQQNYLLLCNNLLDGGITQVVELVDNEYKNIIGSLELTKAMQLKDFDNIFWSIQTKIATNQNNPIEKFTEHVIGLNIPTDSSLYSNMVSDTADLLDSEELKNLATHCINRGFSILSDELAEFFGKTKEKITEVPADTPTNGFIHPADKKIPLAKLIPIMNGLCFKNSLPDALITQLIMNDKLKTFGANVYECFSHVA